MSDKNIEERLERIEDMLEELLSKQQETVEAVQGYVEGLGETVRDAQSSLEQATEEIRELVESSREEDDEDEEDVEDARGPFANEDELYEEVRGFVVAEQKVSTSLLQRRFKIGYGLAARLIDRLAEEGVIGPAKGKVSGWEVLEKEGWGLCGE